MQFSYKQWCNNSLIFLFFFFLFGRNSRYYYLTQKYHFPKAKNIRTHRTAKFQHLVHCLHIFDVINLSIIFRKRFSAKAYSYHA
uniref:Uncharacterized protein n=1 Tax=Rhizophora mucronata TaxID=61149 RepID=A0A2P2NFW5_RHIMU